MKSSILKAALAVTLLMGAQAFANDCGPCEPVCDPCGVTDGSKSCDLFAGLKSLVSRRTPCAEAAQCDPCEGVVACSPCDEVACDPCGNCGDLGCDTSCNYKFSFGKRLKGLFGNKGCDVGPCDEIGGDCRPCDEIDGNCNPCDDTASCSRSFSLRKLFKGFSLGGRCDIGCGNPCDAACDLGNCDPCGEVGDAGNCNPCDNLGDCNPCDDASCNRSLKLGSLLDRPRRGLKKLFEGFSLNGCDAGCNPCDAVGCDPCANVNPCDQTCLSSSQLPEAVK